MYVSLITTTTPLLKSFMVKFKVLGAKPTVVSLKPPYNTIANTDGSKGPQSEQPATDSKERRTRNRFRPGGRKAAKQAQLESGTFSEYSQWMPGTSPNVSARERKREARSIRIDSSHPTAAGNCGDTDVTIKTDGTTKTEDEKERLHDDQADAIEEIKVEDGPR
jgi:hypothetical protein